MLCCECAPKRISTCVYKCICIWPRNSKSPPQSRHQHPGRQTSARPAHNTQHTDSTHITRTQSGPLVIRTCYYSKIEMVILLFPFQIRLHALQLALVTATLYTRVQTHQTRQTHTQSCCWMSQRCFPSIGILTTYYTIPYYTCSDTYWLGRKHTDTHRWIYEHIHQTLAMQRYSSLHECNIHCRVYCNIRC